ncbi:hypothetical protein CHLNCDRAFT_135629 [Chlorella variabilis]|uniref:Uncharacterized protein n=1 Tax=Chlorella variabilis TaxID=554065 RepID=E1ZIM2_CHLVA|nr:hypothetical protein CHLNCDRAFT_135629 [Chlorella variabilis]EFN54358.1 hypothetical protein CHLNCDRAFT_135629 [Chlorella variabilis]|eukprot:XP_005846460.1 hypothetical protein CHLNCDRAFT_135629 [Chlorella variabilis]
MATGEAEALQGGAEFRAIIEVRVKEWVKDHKMFASTLAELAGQLAVLEPPPRSSGGSAATKGPSELLQRVMARAPSDCLQSYVAGTLPTTHMQRQLPEQLDQNLRLLSILAAEMRSFVQQLEQLTDAAASALVQPGEIASSSSDEALLMAAVLDGAGRETQLIEKAAEGITLTTPAEEVSAAATVVQLEPFVDDTLLAALREGPEAGT